MKVTTFFLMVFAHCYFLPGNAQQFPYDEKWAEIEKQESEGRLKSLDTAVNKVYNTSKREKNMPNLIRALLYQSKIAIITDDDDIQLRVIQNFEKEVAEADGVEGGILRSMLAEMLYSYYQNNRWEIDQRTRLEEATTEDFRFWSENIFDDEITALYAKSIENAAVLEAQPVEKWDEILEARAQGIVISRERNDQTIKQRLTAGRELRPTLYDLLAHRVINFYRHQPDVFIRKMEIGADSRDKKEKARQLLEMLVERHRKSGNTNARLYNELEALKMCRAEYDPASYITELEKLAQTDTAAWYTGEVLLEQARFYIEQAGKEEAENFTAKKGWSKKSFALADRIKKDYPDTHTAGQAENLKREILSKTFSIQIESYIPPGRYNPMSVSHKNVSKLHFKVLRYKPDIHGFFKSPVYDLQYAKAEDQQKELDALLRKYPLEKEFSLTLKEFDDYQTHTTNAALDALPAGAYIVLVCDRSDFRVNEEHFNLRYQTVNVTDYALVSDSEMLLLTERECGHPADGMAIEIYQRGNKGLQPRGTVTTDKSGKAGAGHAGDHYIQTYYRIRGEDVFYNHYSYRYGNEPRRQTTHHTRFFTDRSIYRPGQTVYFKGILYEERPNGERQVLKNEKATVELLDPNHKKISELELRSNDFGSVSGEFVLPVGGLTGNFQLQGKNGSYYFSVEEYKRPRFEVVFDTVREIFRLEEKVIARGRAQAYSGVYIDNAKVVYRVYRQAVYPYWPWWKRQYIQPEPLEEIAHGEIMTDGEGEFEVAFEAKTPSRPASTKKEPRTYTYTIAADITDINGETRSGGQSITVGDLRYTLRLDLPERMAWEKLKSIPITTENLNGQFMPVQGELTLTKINPPDRVLRQSPLSAGDYELYDRDEFVSKFPHDPYEKEDRRENWKKDAPVFKQKFDTGSEKEVAVKPARNWKEGYYLLEGHIPDGRDTIRYDQLVYLYKKDKKKPVDNELFAITTDKESYQPGETARVIFASAARDAVVLVELEHDGQIVQSKTLKPDNNVQTFSFPVRDVYRGNVFVHYYFGKFNTARKGTLTIRVPVEENTLKITAGTLRDKLQPGDEETWELTVSGEGRDEFLASLTTQGAEVLATMYDASLDQFKPHDIHWTPYRSLRRSTKRPSWNLGMGYGTRSFSGLIHRQPSVGDYPEAPLFDRINWFGFDINGQWGQNYYRGMAKMADGAPATPVAESIETVEEAEMVDDMDAELSSRAEDVQIQQLEAGTIDTGQGQKPDLSGVQTRKALQETAFFFPYLKTDKDGNIKLNFTTPESLTEWKFMALAHTPELQTAHYETRIRTQKELMVVPNPPRFLREGDEIVFQAKVTNLSDNALSGNVQLLLFDAFSMQPVDADFGNGDNNRKFTTAQGQGADVSWKLKVPADHQAVVWRVVAQAGSFSDGEENALPVLTNRMLVTETLPIHIREGQQKTFRLDKLSEHQSETLENFKLTFEMTTNPVWYAIFSLPYLREFPYECSEQVFARLYANLISQHLVNSNPKIKAVFDDWNAKGQLKSKLELNEELKSLLLEETPWVRQAASEEEQMKRIAVLFDLNRMRLELQSAFHKLQAKQRPSGGFPWFDGGQENTYITTHIVSGFGHLKAMGIDHERSFGINAASMLRDAVQYIDSETEEQWNRYKKNNKYPPSLYGGMYWMYARSYFLKDHPLSTQGKEMADYFLKEFEKEKFDKSHYHQAMLALVFHRFDKKQPARKLLLSVKDNAVESDEMGMYWKDNRPGWHWYNAPIETQALLIEAFDEVLDDTESVELMKVWLLKNRQTNRWVSTKATTEAVFALMSTGKDWISVEGGLDIKLGGEKLDLDLLGEHQTGSGYVKTAWDKGEIKPEMGTVEVGKTSPGVAWGALYWQYFEDLDKITVVETGIRFKKELFLKKLTDKGPELQRITENTPIRVGDLVTVRLEIKNDRDMEFVHIKDMRASGFEPLNVLSHYKWQGGLGYYESTRDAATNFFADRMPKGTYVFEYDLRANNAGDFSNGITSLQCMYAPEMGAHSDGIRVEIR